MLGGLSSLFPEESIVIGLNTKSYEYAKSRLLSGDVVGQATNRACVSQLSADVCAGEMPRPPILNKSTANGLRPDLEQFGQSAG